MHKNFQESKSCLPSGFYAAGFFLKKNKARNCLVSLICYITDVYPPQPAYGELFFTNPIPIFFTAFTYFHLCASILFIRNFSYSWSSVKIYFYSWSSMRIIFYSCISENLFLTIIICENLFIFFYFLFLFFYFLFFCQNIFSYVKIFFYLSEPIFICVHLFLSARISFYLWSSAKIFSYLWSSVKIYFLKSLWKEASVWIPSSKTNLLSSKHDNDILLISYVPILHFLLWILFILCLSTFLLNKVSFNSLNSVSVFTPFAVLDQYFSWNSSLTLIQQIHHLFFPQKCLSFYQ